MLRVLLTALLCMSLLTKHFAFSTGTATAGNTVVCSGFGFQPKAIFVYMVGRTDATDAVGRRTADSNFGIGTSATNRFSACYHIVDAAAAADVGGRYSNAAILEVSTSTGTVAGALDIQSMDADGVTFVIDTQFAADFRVMGIAWGGSDITNANAISFVLDTVVQERNITGVGFQGDLALFIALGSDGAAAAPAADTSPGGLMIGAATGSGAQWVLTAGEDEGSASMDGKSYALDGECIAMQPDGIGTSISERESFVSWQSDGFRLSHLEGAIAKVCFALVLKGGNYTVGSSATRTDTTPFAVSGLSYAPAGGIVVSAMKAESTADTGAAHNQFSVGTFNSATSRGSQAQLDEDAVADAEVTTAVEHDEVYINLSTASAVQGLMDISSMDSGGVTFVMDDADPSAAWFGYVLFGGSGTTAYTLTADAGSYSIAGTAATLKAGRTVAATAGSHSISGTAAGLKVGRTVTSASGTYTLSGTAANLVPARKLVLAAGTYSIGGTAATLKAGRKLSAAAGTYVWTGTDASLIHATSGDYTIGAESGSFSIAGTAATLRVGRVVSAQAGAHTWSGTALTLRAGHRLTSEFGAYVWTGSPATLAFSGAAPIEPSETALRGSYQPEIPLSGSYRPSIPLTGSVE